MPVTDENGFLMDGQPWDDDVARKIAEEQGIRRLNERHWKVIGYIRDYYQTHNRAPMIRKLCQMTCLSLREIYSLFPAGPAQGACKIAGLPKPDGCA